MLREFHSRSKAKVILLLGGYILILCFLFVGNCLTLLFMLLNPRMRTIPNMFVASLAISDVLLGLCSSVPFGIPVLVTSHWLFNDTACQFQGYVSIMLVVASIHTLVLMAVNRYYRIVKPAKYQRYFTKKKTLIMILVSWFSSFCAPLPHVLSGRKIVFHPAKFFCYFSIPNTNMYYGSPLYIGVPTCVIIYCYLRIFSATVRNHNRNVHLPGNPISSVNVEEVKVASTIFVVVVFFNLCWIPVLTVNVLDNVFQRWIFPIYWGLHFIYVFGHFKQCGESFNLRRDEQEFPYELFEGATLYLLPISSCRRTVGSMRTSEEDDFRQVVVGPLVRWGQASSMTFA